MGNQRRKPNVPSPSPPRVEGSGVQTSGRLKLQAAKEIGARGAVSLKLRPRSRIFLSYLAVDSFSFAPVFVVGSLLVPTQSMRMGVAM